MKILYKLPARMNTSMLDVQKEYNAKLNIEIKILQSTSVNDHCPSGVGRNVRVICPSQDRTRDRFEILMVTR